jgi:hypothetical protein
MAQRRPRPAPRISPVALSWILLTATGPGCSQPALQAVGGGKNADGGSLSSSLDADFFKPGMAPDVPPEEGGTRVSDGGGLLNDASLDVVGGVCVPDGGLPGPGPFARRCAAATMNECDGHSDINPQLANGLYGNGFDDDCDGKVDEGCSCDPDHPVGTTKPCALVPGTQIDPATKKPVGWCTVNAVGTVSCVKTDTEVVPPRWDGECRGAQLPFGDDVCAPGDFDCDGKEANSKTQDCACKVDVGCPTAPIVTSPFPDPDKLMPIDGSAWTRGASNNWKWTITGGDCDNILPHPTFAVYRTASANAMNARISSNMPQTGLGLNANQHGFVLGPGMGIGPTIYPAFGLSGDYLVKGEWDGADGHHACTVKVQVRSPGVRVELCWAPMPTDVDLHVARLQNPKKCNHGWFDTCAVGEEGDDCYFGNECSGGFSTNPSLWGYPRSPDSACHGWSSSRTDGCDNPRLDQDNIECTPAVADPMNTTEFCSPENINLDNPRDGDKFAVGVQYYDGPTTKTPRPHVNIYCNGERKLAFGFDATSAPPNNFPVLRKSGLDSAGDIWEVATVEAKVSGGTLTDCLITPVHSKVPKADKDGSRDMCVDTNPMNSNAMGADQWKFTAAGAYPPTADGFCWH